MKRLGSISFFGVRRADLPTSSKSTGAPKQIACSTLTVGVWFAALLVFAAVSAGAQCQGPGAPTTTEAQCLTAISVPGRPIRPFKIGWVKPDRTEHDLSDRSHKGIDIIDTRHNDFKKTIGGFAGIEPNSAGTAVDNNHSGPGGVTAPRSWLHAGGRESTVKVIDLETDNTAFGSGNPDQDALPIAVPSAIIWYVATTGSDSNAGTSAAPFLTIGHAADVVNSGDTVIVESGVYQEALNLTRGGTPGAYVTFESQTPLGAVLDGRNNSMAEAVEFAANYIRFQGFEVRNYGAVVGGGDAFSNYRGGQFIDIARNYIHDIGRVCTDTDNGMAGVFLEGPNVTIEQNLIQSIGRYAPGENGCSPSTPYYKNHDHGVYVDAGSNNVTIKNNIFYRIEHGWGVHVYPNGVDSLSIVNNTFMDYYTYDTGNIVLASSTALTNLAIENNISYSPLTAFIYNYSTTTVTGTVANNLIFAGTVFDTTPSGGVTVTGNILNTDP